VKRHVATFQQQPNGTYEITCSCNTYRTRFRGSRNDAYWMAFQHTKSAGQTNAST